MQEEQNEFSECGLTDLRKHLLDLKKQVKELKEKNIIMLGRISDLCKLSRMWKEHKLKLDEIQESYNALMSTIEEHTNI